MPCSLAHHPISHPLFSRSCPHERRNMRSVWPVGAVWGCLGRQTSSPLTLNGHASRVNTTTYDHLGNATSVRQHGNAVDEIFAEFDYNANSLLTSVRRFEKDDDNTLNEIAESLYTYNANNAVTSITHNDSNGSQIVKHSYTYDSTNNIVEYLNSIDGQTSYDYDFLGQLIGADYSNQNLTDETYTYDENGNRITANGDTYTTGDNNELTSDGTWTYTYDAEGNRISKTNATNRELYTWDHRNRLTTVTQQEWDSVEQDWTTTQIVEYAYEYNNIWIRKVVGENKTIFIPENYQTTVQIDNGTTPHHYLWTPNQQDKLLADTTTSGILWALTDHLGTIRDVLDGNSSTHLIYDAFGNLISGTNPLLFGYTGKAFDSDTNLQNNINRWYDATIGRWLSVDPIGFEGNDTNLYRYVFNAPALKPDFQGLKGDTAQYDSRNAVQSVSYRAGEPSIEIKRRVLNRIILSLLISIEEVHADCYSQKECLTAKQFTEGISNLPYVGELLGAIDLLKGDAAGATAFLPNALHNVSREAANLVSVAGLMVSLNKIQSLQRQKKDIDLMCREALKFLNAELSKYNAEYRKTIYN